MKISTLFSPIFKFRVIVCIIVIAVAVIMKYLFADVYGTLIEQYNNNLNKSLVTTECDNSEFISSVLNEKKISK